VPVSAEAPQVYLVMSGSEASAFGLDLAEKLRSQLPWIRIEVDLGGGSFKGQFKRADRSNATVALVLGPDELAKGAVVLKLLRGAGGQEECSLADLSTRLAVLVGQ